MKRFIKRSVSLLVVIAFALNISGCATPYKMHPDFKERHKNIHSASMVKPDIEAYLLTFKGEKQRLHDLIPKMERTTTYMIEKILKEKGYEIKKLNLKEETLESNPDLRTTLFNVQKLFSKSLDDISKRKKKVFTYSIGSDVNILADEADCDVLVFVKEEAIKKSAGEIAKDVIKGVAITAAALLIGVVYVPIPQTAATLVHIAIVDSNDGAILWYTNNLNNINWDPENQSQLAQLLKQLLVPFPKSIYKKEPEKVDKDGAEHLMKPGPETRRITVSPPPDFVKQTM